MDQVHVPAQRAARPAPRGGWRRTMRAFLPPQHGAWAMLVVPYLVGGLLAGWSWVSAPLLVAWIAGYLLSYYAFQAVKTRRPGRWRAQLTLYGAITVPLVTLVVAARPAVLWYAPAYALLLLVNAGYAARRQERALLNDLASVLLSCLMVGVAATVAGMDPLAPTWPIVGAFLACTGYFAGTAFYVKTMIRERGERRWRWWSVGYHAGALAGAVWLGPTLAVLFTWFLIRAWWLPRKALVPKQVGMIEIGNSLLLVLAILLTWG
ncbi:MAG TPA: YwiC-like family protein [Natronosporangium sp.]|nr:YwiC-like family protein [Natronosporangium sp.]